MGVMMAPSVLGIFTDIVGIFLIALAPIPAMERFALFCGFWAIWLIPTGVVLISLLLAALPPPKNIDKLVGEAAAQTPFNRAFKKLLQAIASVTYGRRGKVTAVITAVLGIAAIVVAFQIRIGNPVEGSNLLWDYSEFNQAVREINRSFPGVNTLEIVLEAKNQRNPDRVVRQADTIMTMLKLQNIMESGAAPPRATLSFADYMMEGNRLFSGGSPKWLPLDPTNESTGAASIAVMMGSSPKAFSHVVDFDIQNGTVSLWYKDNKQGTVDAALAAARKAVEEVGVDHAAFTVRLGTGTIALQQAMNHVVERYHWVIISLLNFVILLGCSYAYRSFVAGLILLVPVNLSNFVLLASMHVMGIGLDINSLMVASIGVGVGIDYGIYLLSRICEEFHAQDGDIGAAITASLSTTGKAIMFTASIMLLGIMPWYFLSDLKFLADMGLLLVLIMLINMVLALVVLPLLVWLVNPRFLSREDLLVGEGVDLSKYTAAREGHLSGAALSNVKRDESLIQPTAPLHLKTNTSDTRRRPMHIRKFDFDYSRRMFMGKTLAGAATAGVLAPLWPEIANSADVSKAYPDELLSISMYTKGKIKPGDVLTADNVDAVKDLLDPVAFKQVKDDGPAHQHRRVDQGRDQALSGRVSRSDA
jgi:predicted RND superfamily exporter protein